MHGPGHTLQAVEAALALAMQEEECAHATGLRGGVLTPATAMGMVLVQRLRDAGFFYDIVRSPALKAGAPAGAVEAKAKA
jgi:short subunit dehydrogenase-like uncharacterized protein